MTLCALTATKALKGLQAGRFSALEYVEELLDCASSGSALNAFSSLPADLILEQARSSDEIRRTSSSAGLLCGLPIAIKDNINVAHQQTSAGTPGLHNHYPTSDAPVIAALRDAGAIVFGRTLMHELAYGLTSNNAAFGAVRNPFDPDRIAGGSSGGSAAAVAAHMVPCALGTDTGGSVRVPAAFCGVVGFRPTHGRYPGEGIVPISHSRDTAGPITRSVEDAILLDGIMSAQKSNPAPVSTQTLRIGVPRGYFFDQAEPEVISMVERALRQLSELGITLIEAEISGLVDCNRLVGRPIVSGEVIDDLPAYLQEHAPGIAMKDILDRVASPDVRQIILDQFDPKNRAGIVAAYELAISTSRPKLAQNYAQYFFDHQLDAIALPTTLVTAPLIGSDETILLNGAPVPTGPALVHNTGPSSIIGVPGLTLPVGMSASGLPVGLELEARAGCDSQLLAIGLALEPHICP